MLDFECKSLRKVPLFQHVDPKCLQLIAFAANRVSFQPGETVFAAGSEADAMFIVVEGEVESFTISPEGKEVSLSHFGPGRSFGDVAVLNESDRFMTVKAVLPTMLLQISRSDFLELTQAIPQFALAVMRDLARRLTYMIKSHAAAPPI